MTEELTIDDTHRLQGTKTNPVQHWDSPNQTRGRRGLIQATIGIAHWTGGDRFSPVKNTFLHPNGGASAHFVVERDGTIHQFVSCDRKAWHAGKSSWAGRRNTNNYSIGVELVCAGLLKEENGKFFTRGRNKREIPPGQVRQVDGRPYHKFSREQFNSLRQIMRALCLKYSIDKWVGHSDVSPGRKSDPGPILSLEELAKMLSSATNMTDDQWAHYCATPSTTISVFPDWMRSLFSIFDPKETR